MKILFEKNKTDFVKEDHGQMHFSHSKYCLKSKGNLTWLHIWFYRLQKAFEDEVEDVSSYWMTFRKRG
jgi:hypothetical protein